MYGTYTHVYIKYTCSEFDDAEEIVNVVLYVTHHLLFASIT